MLEKSIEASLRDEDFEITSAQTLQDKENSMDTVKRKYEDFRREISTSRPYYQMDSSNLTLLATGKDPDIIISDSFLNSKRINTTVEEPHVSPEFSAITTPNSLNSEKKSEAVEKLDALLPENPESTIPDSVKSEEIGNLLDEPDGSISGYPKTRMSNSLNLEAKSNTVEKEPNILLPEDPKSLEEPDVSLPEDPKIIMSNFLNLEASSDTVEASGILLPTYPRSLEELDVALPEHSKATIPNDAVGREPNILLSEDPKSLEEPDVPLLHWKTTMPNSLSSEDMSDIMKEPSEKNSNTVKEALATSDDQAQNISNSMDSDASNERVEESKTVDKGYQEKNKDSEEKKQNNDAGMSSTVNELQGLSPKPHIHPREKLSEADHYSRIPCDSKNDWWKRRPEKRHGIVAGTLITKHFNDGPFDGVVRKICSDSEHGKTETFYNIEFSDGDKEELTFQEVLPCANLYTEMASSLTTSGKILKYNETTAYYFAVHNKETVQSVAKMLGCKVEAVIPHKMEQPVILRIDPLVCDSERIKPLLLIKNEGWLRKERKTYLWRSVDDIPPLVEYVSDHADESEENDVDALKKTFERPVNSKTDQTFNNKLGLLDKFIQQHGNCNIPRKTKKYIHDFRYDINEGRITLTKDRVAALKGIGFKVIVGNKMTKQRVEELKVLGFEFQPPLHTLSSEVVPQKKRRRVDNNYIKAPRDIKKRKEQSIQTHSSDLPEPPKVNTGNKRSDDIFHKHLCYLQKFIHKRGHGNVSNKDNSSLRKYLYEINNGKKNMSDERVEALKSVGYKFPASSPFADKTISSSNPEGQAEQAEGTRDLCKPPYVDTGNKISDDIFHKHLCNLQMFIHEHGHHQIDRSHKKTMNQLRDFCHRINKQGRSKLHKKKVEALEAIGFKFQTQTSSSDILFDENTKKGDQRTEVTQPASCTHDSDVQRTEKHTTTMSDNTSCDNRVLGATSNSNSISETTNRPLGNTQENDLPVSSMQEDNSNSEIINRPLRNTQDNDLPVSTTQEDNKRSGELLSLRERIAILEDNLDVSRDGNLRPKERVLILMEKAGEPRDGANISTCIEKLERDWNFNDLPVSTMQEDNSNSERINRTLGNTQENDLLVSAMQEGNKRSGEALSLRERIAILEDNLDVSRDDNLRPKERVLILMEKVGEQRDGANISTCIEKLERDWNF